jgi:hypothetical protein
MKETIIEIIISEAERVEDFKSGVNIPIARG